MVEVGNEELEPAVPVDVSEAERPDRALDVDDFLLVVREGENRLKDVRALGAIARNHDNGGVERADLISKEDKTRWHKQ